MLPQSSVAWKFVHYRNAKACFCSSLSKKTAGRQQLIFVTLVTTWWHKVRITFQEALPKHLERERRGSLHLWSLCCKEGQRDFWGLSNCTLFLQEWRWLGWPRRIFLSYHIPIIHPCSQTHHQEWETAENLPPRKFYISSSFMLKVVRFPNSHPTAIKVGNLTMSEKVSVREGFWWWGREISRCPLWQACWCYEMCPDDPGCTDKRSVRMKRPPPPLLLYSPPISAHLPTMSSSPSKMPALHSGSSMTSPPPCSFLSVSLTVFIWKSYWPFCNASRPKTSVSWTTLSS